MLIDLQLHSTYSDGYLTPTEVVKFIASHGVKVASLTDHNTVGGLEEFRQACHKYKIKPIIGLELYIKVGTRRMNFLWFNFDEHNPDLHKMLRMTQIKRRNSMRKILKKLSSQGFKINIEKILDKYTHYTPLNHIIDDLKAVPFNSSKIKKELNNNNPREEEIINRYFYNPKGNMIRESYVDIKRILKLRKKIGGQLILNHPGKHNQLQKELLEKLKKMGIDGIEVLSPHHSFGAIMYAQYIARELDFITTGGSDFHRHEGYNFPLQNSLEYFEIRSRYLKGVKKIIE